MEQMIKQPDTSAIANRADDLIASVGRAVVDSPENDNKAGDLLKMLKSIKKQAEDDRKAITGPINQAIKTINQKYKLITDPVDKAIKDLSGKMVAYKQEVQRIAREKEEQARKEREAKALEEAAKLEEQGKTEAAEEVVEAAESASEKTQAEASKSTVRSDYGATTTMKDNWSAEVVDIRILCHAIAKGDVPPEYVTANMPALNKVAKAEKDNMNVPGVEAVNNPTLASR
jgi:hypothetical protein